MTSPCVSGWVERLLDRHTSDLTFSELRRGLQALSAVYVQKRDRLSQGAALDGKGKRAAFAAFYGPLHFLLVREIVAALEAEIPAPRKILDLGCGTGVVGAAWATAAAPAGAYASVSGVDINPWALGEARWNAATLGVSAKFRRASVTTANIPAEVDAIACGFVVNELNDAGRDSLLTRLIAAGARGVRVLVIEPIARRPLTWWDGWRGAFEERGGRHDTWRFPAELPPRLATLDKAAHLDHRELTGRSLYMPAT